jgi:hypothetical protein
MAKYVQYYETTLSNQYWCVIESIPEDESYILKYKYIGFTKLRWSK